MPVQRVLLMFWKYLLLKKKVDGKRPNFSLRFCWQTRGGLMLANFLIYINDISSSSDKLKSYLFADNTNFSYADKNLKSLESIFNAEISRVYNWLIANKLSLNIKKSDRVVSRPRQKKLNHQVNLKVFDHHNNSYISLECNNHVKYLGVLISLACVSSETHNLQCVFLRI